jgi:hypothetical protein
VRRSRDEYAAGGSPYLPPHLQEDLDGEDGKERRRAAAAGEDVPVVRQRAGVQLVEQLHKHSGNAVTDVRRAMTGAPRTCENTNALKMKVERYRVTSARVAEVALWTLPACGRSMRGRGEPM